MDTYQSQHRIETVIGIVAVMSLFLFSFWVLFFYRLPGNNAYWGALQDSGHSLLFTLFSFLFSHCLRRIKRTLSLRNTFIISFVVCLLFGALVELIQSRIGRQASWSDFWLDTAGTLSGLLLFSAVSIRGRIRYALLLLAAIPLFISLFEPLTWKHAEIQRKKLFPSIANFDNFWLNKYVHSRYSGRLSFIKAPEEWEGNHSSVAKLDFRPGSWPGLYLVEVEKNWRGYQNFNFEVYNPSDQTLVLVLRIHDRLHNHKHSDRFNRTFHIAPGVHSYSVSLDDVEHAPKKRDMNMGMIHQVFFYMSRPKESHTLYFDNIALN